MDLARRAHHSPGHLGIHTYIYHCMHEASVLILLVMYYMATHTERDTQRHTFIH